MANRRFGDRRCPRLHRSHDPAAGRRRLIVGRHYLADFSLGTGSLANRVLRNSRDVSRASPKLAGRVGGFLFGPGGIPAGVTRDFNLLNLLIEAGRRRGWQKKSLTLGA